MTATGMKFADGQGFCSGAGQVLIPGGAGLAGISLGLVTGPAATVASPLLGGSFAAVASLVQDAACGEIPSLKRAAVSFGLGATGGTLTIAVRFGAPAAFAEIAALTARYFPALSQTASFEAQLAQRNRKAADRVSSLLASLASQRPTQTFVQSKSGGASLPSAHDLFVGELVRSISESGAREGIRNALVSRLAEISKEMDGLRRFASPERVKSFYDQQIGAITRCLDALGKEEEFAAAVRTSITTLNRITPPIGAELSKNMTGVRVP